VREAGPELKIVWTSATRRRTNASYPMSGKYSGTGPAIRTTL